MRGRTLIVGAVLAIGLFGKASADDNRAQENTAVCISGSNTRLFAAVTQEILAIKSEQALTRCLQNTITRYNKCMSVEDTLNLAVTIQGTAGEFDLDPLLVASVIAVESSFNPRARSHCGAEGLMQILGSVQPLLHVEDPFDVGQNVRGGCRFLRELKNRFHRLDLTLAAYNAGPNRVARLGGIPPIQETVHYVRRAMALYRRLGDELAVLQAEPLQADAVVAGLAQAGLIAAARFGPLFPQTAGGLVGLAACKSSPKADLPRPLMLEGLIRSVSGMTLRGGASGAAIVSSAGSRWVKEALGDREPAALCRLEAGETEKMETVVKRQSERRLRKAEIDFPPRDDLTCSA